MSTETSMIPDVVDLAEQSLKNGLKRRKSMGKVDSLGFHCGIYDFFYPVLISKITPIWFQWFILQ